MRTLPDDLAASLASGATTLAHAWRIERRDGAVFGFTDHDGDITFDDVTYHATTGLAAGALETSPALAIDRAQVEGALSSDAIDPAELAAGLWDGARVDIWRVDWSSIASRVRIFSGRLGEVRRGEHAFAAELRGLQAAYDAPTGRVFSRFCDADVGDARCTINLADPAYRGSGAVSAVLGAGRFRASGLDGFAPGWFERGVLTWTSGGAADVVSHRVEGGVVIELAAPIAIVAGAEFTITAGCDKRLETCAGKFINVLNFRGVPRMPGNDAVQSGPTADGRNDGSSRWTG